MRKHLVQLLVLTGLLLIGAWAEATPIARYARFTGTYNYVATGGSLRTESNSGNACALSSTSSQALSGIPAGATVVAAYLYWGGSGSTIDSSVTLNGSTVIASRTFTTTFNNAGTNYPYFGGFADVTSRISSNGTVTFGGLNVNSGSPHCSVQAVVAGWSLLVVYSASSEPLRALNVFDGLDYFRGSAVSQTPDGYRIPTSNIDGKMTVVTWEGDPANSEPLNGFSESLTYNGNALDDGINVAGSDPTVQQYDGTVNTLGLSDTYGVDVDTYDISALLSAGQTSGTTNYSAGNDLVLLTAQIVSVTSEPVVDLSLTKSHSGNFTVGNQGVFTLQVSNGSGTGVISVDYPITVTDVLPTGMSFVSGSGTNWSCSASGQTVTCVNSNASNLQPGASLPALTLTVNVGNGVFPNGNTAQNVTVSNTASVSAPGTADINSANNSASDSVLVLGSNLSASTKSVSDLNGGEANVGDTLRYTITLINSSAVAATGVSVSDPLPGNTSNLSVVSYPAGAANTSSSSVVNIGNITVPANGNVTVVFEVIVATGTSPGATIDNTATITNPAGIGATPSATQVEVSPSLVASSGTKQLYLWSNPARLYRTRPTGTHNLVTVTGGGNATWNITPTLQKDLELRGGSGIAGNFPVYLLIDNSGSNTGSARAITVTLLNGATTLATASQSVPAATTPTLRTFTLNLPNNVTVTAGSTLSLRISNGAGSGRSIDVTPYSGGTYSRVELNSLTVINVDSVQSYNAAYAGGLVASSFNRGSTAYVRAVVSDPFGSFDISSATITLRNPSGTDVVTAASMTQVNDSGTAFKTYEYAYAIPANAPAGYWTARVTANEGVEGVSDLGVSTFTVTIPMPTLAITKISEVMSDPVNNTTNPKRIPGSVVRYSLSVVNSGVGTVDASSLVLTDALPTNTALCVSTACSSPVIEFIDGSPASGLSFNAASDVTYSNTAGGGAPFSYTPTPDANGFDAAVTGLRIAPSGSMQAAGSGNPGFTVRFRVRVQ